MRTTTRTFAMALASIGILLGVTLGTGITQAQTVLVDGSGTNATGILNLEVDADLYNVEFLFDFGGDLFTLPLLFPVELQALAATSAVANALNAESAVVTVGADGGINSDFYDIPFEFELNVGWSVRSAEYFPIAGGGQPLMNPGLVPDLTPSSYAVFTPVPEPGAGAALLMGLGLALGVVGRRQGKKSEATG